MKKITVVFPMAGEGQRFGNKFKPFLKIFNKTFIELAIEPFLKHKEEIKKFVFIIRDDHRKQFNVIEKITDFHLPISTSVIIVEPTKNVIETISPLFDHSDFIRDVVFCDCDHSLNVDQIFEAIQRDKYDCIIPGWSISKDEAKSWSVAAVNLDNTLIAIKEKAYPEGKNFFGVIGCYYFRKLNKPSEGFNYLSDIISYFLIDNKKVKLIPIKEAEFFGDPQRLENLYISKQACTIFCDLDGTIIEHENIPDYTKGIKILEGAKEIIDQWRKNYAFIVLTTSRDEQFRPEMELMLRNAGIKYEYMVMGLPPGARYLINDKKPYSDIEMARAFEVERNIGIKSIGHSLASFSVRNVTGYKYIPQNAPQYQKDKFKAQFDSMQAIRLILPSLVPCVSNFTGNSYAIEYLEGYAGLHTFKDKISILNRLFKILPSLYAEESEFPDYWLWGFLEDKIYSKAKDLERLNLSTKIIDFVKEIAEKEFTYLSPVKMSVYFHGDLTYENIMVKEDIKLIDFDNDNLPGCAELDLGKLMQSILTGYEGWDKETQIINNDSAEFNSVIDFYTKLLGQSREQVINKAYFYCALHLIRMIPYQAKTSERRARLALYWAEQIINKWKQKN